MKQRQEEQVGKSSSGLESLLSAVVCPAEAHKRAREKPSTPLALCAQEEATLAIAHATHVQKDNTGTGQDPRMGCP